MRMATTFKEAAEQRGGGERRSTVRISFVGR
jgi:hypothetical protein